MGKYKQINLEAGMPHVDDAIARFRREAEAMKRTGGCLYVIHGYGSHGVGGRIKEELHRILPLMRSNGKIKGFIPGEKFEMFNFDALAMKNRYKELEPLLRSNNRGVTVVEV